MQINQNWQDSLKEDLSSLKDRSLYRSLEISESAAGARIRIARRRYLNFSSNNYLGLTAHPAVKKAAATAALRWGAGSGASRLVSGDLKIHRNLENRLARFKKEESALIFSSGYLANLGTVTALVRDRDLVLVDRLNHASLIDAARLSGAKLWVYPHRDMAALERLLERGRGFEKKLVVSDAYFSMDGDVAPLDQLQEICGRRKAMLMVDEAHSTGVFGRNGRGLTEHFGLSGKIDVVMGTLSKALGSVGGFIAGKSILREYLINRSRSFIYTTAPCPAASGAALAAISVIESQPDLRRKYWDNIHYLREQLKSQGFDLLGSEGPIIPLLIGEPVKTLKLKEFLRTRGIFVSAIRPPTVPKGTDRIRLSVLADHAKEDLNLLLGALREARRKFL